MFCYTLKWDRAANVPSVMIIMIKGLSLECTTNYLSVLDLQLKSVCVLFCQMRITLTSWLFRARARHGTLRPRVWRREIPGYRPLKARSWPACSCVRAAKTRQGSKSPLAHTHTISDNIHRQHQWDNLTCRRVSQARKNSQSEAVALQAIRNAKGNNLCVDCEAPSESAFSPLSSHSLDSMS